MIPGRNKKTVIIIRWKVTVPFVSHILIMDSTRTSRVEPGFVRFRRRERVRNECLHARDDHLSYAFCTTRRVSVMEAVIIPWKISIVAPQVVPLSRGIMPKASLLRWVLGRHWRDRARSRDESVVGGAQRREKFNSVSRRVGS